MVPVVRTMAALASTLAAELGALAVCWQPAGSWMDVSISPASSKAGAKAALSRRWA